MKAKGAFFNIPAHGHVNPTLAVVKELVTRGEVIDYYCTEEFREKIEKTGANFIALPFDLVKESTFKNFSLLAFFADLLESANIVMPYLEAKISVEQYSYILTDFYTPWGRILAEKKGLPLGVFNPIFAMKEQIKSPPIFLLQLLASPFINIPALFRIKKNFKLLKQKYKLKNVEQPLDLAWQDIEGACVVFTTKSLQPQSELFPAHYAFTGANIDVSVREKDPNFPWEKLENQKVLYISLGSIVYNPKFYRKCIQAFANTEYTVVMNIGNKLDIADYATPDNFIICNYVPQLELLPKCSVFITHGGMNSMQEGIYFEVPLVVVPHAFDQFLVAKTIADKKLGAWLNAHFCSVRSIRKAVKEVIDNQAIQQNLKIKSQELKEAGGAARAATEIQKIIPQNET